MRYVKCCPHFCKWESWKVKEVKHVVAQIFFLFLKFAQLLLSVPYSFYSFIYLFIFRERGREGGREGEKHQCVVASPTPPIGDLTLNPGMCLTGNGTSDLLVCRLALNPLSHTSQGCTIFWLKSVQWYEGGRELRGSPTAGLWLLQKDQLWFPVARES